MDLNQILNSNSYQLFVQLFFASGLIGYGFHPLTELFDLF